MSDRLRVGVDCDGVIYHWERTARYMLRRKYTDEGREYPLALEAPSTGWDMIERVVEPADWEWLWAEGVEQGLFRHGHIVGGALEGLTALTELADVVIVTSRPAQAVNDTLSFLAHHCQQVPLSGIHILSHGQPKSSVRPALDVLVDDGPHNIQDFVENTDGGAIIYDQEWNKNLHPVPPGAVRAYGWKDVVANVEKLVEYPSVGELKEEWDTRAREII